MTQVRIQDRAAAQLDQIYRYTRERWGQRQAEEVLRDLFTSFDHAASGAVASRPIPAEFGVSGFFYRCGKHVVYWRRLTTGEVGIVTVLHERMHQIEPLRESFTD